MADRDAKNLPEKERRIVVSENRREELNEQKNSPRDSHGEANAGNSIDRIYIA
jgi:hypothetical protein